MPDFIVKGHTFSVPARFRAGHKATLAEAEILNRIIGRAVRAALADNRISSRDDALEFSRSDEALSYSRTPEEGSLEDLA